MPAAVLCLVSVALAAVGLLIGFGSPAADGLRLTDDGSRVVTVVRDSSAWRAGIRAGQHVTSTQTSDDAGGWRIETADTDSTGHAVNEQAARAARLVSVPFAAGGAILGLIGLASVGRRRRRAEAAGAAALALAWAPFYAGAIVPLDIAIFAAAALAVVVWLARWSRLWPWVTWAAAAVGGGAVTLWVAAYLLDPERLAPANDVRFLAMPVLVAVLGVAAPGTTASRIGDRLRTLTALDVVAIMALIGVVVAMQVAEPPFPTAIVAPLVLVVAYGRARGFLRTSVDRLLFAEGRERIAIGAAESERARLSRDLHDEPLQAIAGVIHRLEQHPDTAPEQETLRTVAAQLRSVATELHPPVLDDLGLVPAIEALAASSGSVPITVKIDGSPRFRPEDRPPAEVELAAFRVAQEATSNASRHAGGSRIEIVGTVRSDLVILEIVDDGRGVSDRTIEDALRSGHLGIASMRRRADAVDAHLELVPSTPGGTTVRFRWAR